MSTFLILIWRLEHVLLKNLVMACKPQPSVTLCVNALGVPLYHRVALEVLT